MPQKRKAEDVTTAAPPTTHFKRMRRCNSENSRSKSVLVYGGTEEEPLPASQPALPNRAAAQSMPIVLSDSSEESDDNSVIEVESGLSASQSLTLRLVDATLCGSDGSIDSDIACGDLGIIDVYAGRQERSAEASSYLVPSHGQSAGSSSSSEAKSMLAQERQQQEQQQQEEGHLGEELMKNAYLRTAQQTARHSESAASAVASQLAGSSDVRGNERLSYLHTFDRILHTVLSAESYLFSEQEKETLVHFKDLDRHARYIFARLFMRKPAWIRVSSLNYGEQTEVAESCRILGERKQEGQEPFVLTESEIENCDEAISLLTVAELRALAKSRGIKQVSGKAKDALCAMIVRSAKQKTVLSFFQQNKAESSKQRTDVLVKAIVKLTGPMVKLNPLMVELFERLHLVFFRSPMLSPDDRTMKVAILATIGQIRFPNYKVMRSPDLFASREDVITYKRLLEVGNHMAELAMSPVKAVDHHRQGWEMFLSYRDAWKRHVESLRSLADARAATAAATLDGIEAGESSIAYWKRHFTPGWALARIVERGAKFASSLKQYQNEEDILLSLLAQKTYRLGKRGEWYERLVLLRTTHLKPKRAKGDEEAENKVRTLLLKARDACIRALDDKYVSRISLHSISRQLRSIESKLGIEESQLCEHPRMCLEWKEAPERTVYGVRIKNPSRRGPSLWDGDDEVPCSVEQLAIWRYRSLGYEGLHSENTIATTLFGLIFWDIIFHPLPGVLDTEYQSRPLDMGSESFCYSRQPLIDKRLQRVAAGDYAGAIQTVYDTEYGAECVGVSWEYTIDQLLTIAECIGGKGLATICKVLAKEYRLKSSGFPDLCLWNSTTKKVLFAEVKGPNDKLSEAQRDWIDILLSSGIDVELCLVREGDARDYRDQ